MKADVKEPLAIFAGAGDLPAILADVATAQGRHVLAMRIHGEAEPDFVGHETHDIRYGEVGRVLAILKERSCRSVILAGRIDRPSLAALRPDWGAMKLMPRIARIFVGGDDRLLRSVADLMAEHDLNLLSPLDIAPELSAGEGILTKARPDREASADIAVGLRTARMLGQSDAGQSVIVHGGRAVALEGIEGTDAMIARAGSLRSVGRWRAAAPSGILVKTAKPQQDMRLDVPTIGPETVDAAVSAGLAGIAIEAERVLILHRDEVIRRAQVARIFVTSVA